MAADRQPGPQTLAARAPEWERLRELLTRAQGLQGISALGEDELWELPSLYRKALSDLSLVRTRGGQPQLEQELTQLCNAAHSIVYQRTVRGRRFSLREHLFVILPQTTRRHAGLILINAAIMVLFAVLGWIHTDINPTLPESILSPRLVAGIHTSLRAAREQADLGLAAQIEPSDRMAAAVEITLNNVMVSLRAFLFGILAGVLTIIIIAINGYLLGVVAYLYIYTDPGIPINLPLYFIHGIAPHGSIELPAICIAGAAGMLLGFSWVFPGQRPRGDALRAAATEAWRLMQVCALTLLVAGTIEGFVTPLNPPETVGWTTWYWLKIAIGALVFAGWFAWLYTGGRRN